jgi:tetratricopeptide (TPR) repeat protein
MRGLCFLILTLIPASLVAEPFAQTPLQLQVVIAVDDHPTFTPRWKQTITEELRPMLGNAVGAAGNVTIRFATPEERSMLGNLQLLPPSTGTGKTHFVGIHYRDGIFDIRTRQNDQDLRFITPVIRQETTRDRRMLARIIGFLIQRDLGVVGEFQPGPAANPVELVLQGSGRDPIINRLVNKGDLFAVIQLRQSGNKSVTPQTTRADSVLLQVSEVTKEGSIRTRILQRYVDPLATGPGIQYRAIKLGTTEMPLQLRLIEANGTLIGQRVRVQVHPERFPELPNEGKELTFKDGLFQSVDPMPNLACARVLLGDRVIARLPIELLEPGIITRTIKVDPQAETQQRYEAMRRDLLTRFLDSRRAVNRCFQDLITLERAGKKNEALDRAINFDSFLISESTELTQELERVRGKVQKEGFDPPGFWLDCERNLATLKGKQTELVDHVGKLREAIRIENDPAILAQRKKVQDLINEAELLVNQADFDAAIAKYEQAIKELGDTPAPEKLVSTLTKLKEGWAIKDPEHGKAREFLLGTWLKASTSSELTKHLTQAKRAGNKCKDVGDKLTLNRVSNFAPETLSKLDEEVKQLLNQDTAEADLKRAALKKLIDDLETFYRDLNK